MAPVAGFGAYLLTMRLLVGDAFAGFGSQLNVVSGPSVSRIFDHATPEQLACFGVQPPGDPFWTEATLARAQARYPGWDLTPYRSARHEVEAG